MKKIILTESQVRKIADTLVMETQSEMNLDKVQNFIKYLRDTKFFDPSVVNKYMVRINRLPFSEVLSEFVREFKYDPIFVEKVLNKKRADVIIRKGEDPFTVRKKSSGTSVDTSFNGDLNLNEYLELLNQTVQDEKIKKYLIGNIFNPKFFVKLNLVLGDFFPRYNEMKQEYQSTKKGKTFNDYTLADLSDFKDPFTGEPLTYTEEDLQNEKTKPIIKGDVIFKNMGTYALSNQLIYARNILKNIMSHDPKKHQLIDHTVRSVNRYLSGLGFDPEMRRQGRPTT